MLINTIVATHVEYLACTQRSRKNLKSEARRQNRHIQNTQESRKTWREQAELQK